ncbi:MAG: hypothetical protein AAGF11_35195 [Myxococcota bacterium]
MAAWPTTGTASVPLRPGDLGSNTPICCQYPSRRVNACLEWSDGTYTLEARGHRPEKLTDEMGFVYTVLEGDFSFVARLADAPELSEGCMYGNYGLAVRDDLVGNDSTVMLRYQRNESGTDRWNVQYREAPTEPGTNYCTGDCFIDKYSDGPFAGQADGMWLRLERQDGQVTTSLSEDGEQWQPLGAPMALQQPEVYVGMFMACGNKGIAVAQTVWDHVEVTADHEPWGGTIGPGAASEGCAQTDEFSCDEKLGLPPACAYEGAPRAGYPEPDEAPPSEPPSEPPAGDDSESGGGGGRPPTEDEPSSAGTTGGEDAPSIPTTAGSAQADPSPETASSGCTVGGRERGLGTLWALALLGWRRRRSTSMS